MCVLVLIYLACVVAFEGLTFAPTKDERHFWPTSLEFSSFPPSVSALRSYNELNTPLPFVVFGAIEGLFQGGIAAGRAVNLVLSFLMVCVIGFAAGQPTSRAFLSVAGLLSFPYFLGVATHLYTDIMASFFVLSGVVFHLKGGYAASALSFILAIACRQYAVAFPLAILVGELLVAARLRSPIPRGPALASLAAVASLAGWYLFFGGFAPPVALAAQGLDTGRLFVDHGLYFLACVGVYFVLVEAVLFRRRFWEKIPPAGYFLATAIAILFLFFPPLQNVNFAIPAMGFLDVAARWAFNDILRMTLLGVLAVCAALRFSRFDLSSLFVWANALIMMKAHIGWDKYALPLLVVLWYMKSLGALDGHNWPRDASGERSLSPGADRSVGTAGSARASATLAGARPSARR
jgi:hypothetical protein